MKRKVSVIMSTCNTKEEYLNCAIVSILNQTFEDFEFIIVNDGGNNLEFLEKYTDKRIKLIEHEESKGLPCSLNEAIQVSTGEYIARMDSDDISLPFRLMEQVKFMDKNKDIDICGTFYKYFDGKNDFVLNVLNSSDEVKAQMFGKNALAHPSVMIRKSFLIENNLTYSKNFKYSQDFDLWTRSLKYGRIAILPKVCFLYRIHVSQISSNKKKDQMLLYESILKRNLQNLKLNESNITFLKMLNNLEIVDFNKLSKFIDDAIDANNIVNYYNKKIFKKVLYNFYFLVTLKSENKISKLFNKKYLKKNINFYNGFYLLKKIYYLIKEKILLKQKCKGVEIYV